MKLKKMKSKNTEFIAVDYNVNKKKLCFTNLHPDIFKNVTVKS